MTFLVVRGGVLADLDRVLRAARLDFYEGYGREHGLGLCLSVFAAEQADGEARDAVLCRIVTAGHIRNRQIRVADLAAVVEAGFRGCRRRPPRSTATSTWVRSTHRYGWPSWPTFSQIRR